MHACILCACVCAILHRWSSLSREILNETEGKVEWEILHRKRQYWSQCKMEKGISRGIKERRWAKGFLLISFHPCVCLQKLTVIRESRGEKKISSSFFSHLEPETVARIYMCGYIFFILLYFLIGFFFLNFLTPLHKISMEDRERFESVSTYFFYVWRFHNFIPRGNIFKLEQDAAAAAATTLGRISCVARSIRDYQRWCGKSRRISCRQMDDIPQNRLPLPHNLFYNNKYIEIPSPQKNYYLPDYLSVIYGQQQNNIFSMVVWKEKNMRSKN